MQLKAALSRLGRFGAAVENGLLLILLLAMIGLSVAQIVLRNFFDIGFFWTDELLRLMVLWMAVVGGIAASRTDRHISINLVDNFLNGKGKLAAGMVIHAFSSFVCAVVTWFSIDFVKTSHEYGDVLLGGVPAWWLQAVLPVGFALISYRYLLFFVVDVLELFGMKIREETS